MTKTREATETAKEQVLTIFAQGVNSYLRVRAGLRARAYSSQDTAPFVSKLGGESGVYALLYYVMRGQFPANLDVTSTAPLIHRPRACPIISAALFFAYTFCVVPGLSASDFPTLGELEKYGSLFRQDHGSVLPYAVLERIADTLRSPPLSPTFVRSLATLARWDTFEAMFPNVECLLARAYFVIGRDTVALHEFYRGAYGSETLLSREISINPCSAYVEEKQCVLEVGRMRKRKQGTRFVDWRAPSVKGSPFPICLSERGKSCVFQCAPGNEIFDTRSFWWNPGGAQVLVVTHAKFAASDATVPLADITEWYRVATSLVEAPSPEGEPACPVLPENIIYIWVCNKRLSEENQKLLTTEFWQKYPKLLMFLAPNLPSFLSSLFSVLL